MSDLGDPTSYLQIEEGVPVLSSDGQEIGKLEHVLADESADIFDGVIVDTRTGPGGWRFADASQVEAFHVNAVVLKLDAEAAAGLPEPEGNPAVVDAGPDDVEPPTAGDRLRRAWDYISGKY